MINNILVSVAVTTYGHEKYIRQALDSILMQEVNFTYEIMIGEDCSPDQTRNILLEYKAKYPDIITLFLRDQNIGSTENYYDICIHCRGKYIATLEGDDYWIDKRKLQKQVDFLEQNPDYIGVSHVLESRDLKDQLLERLPLHVKKNMDITIEDFLQKKFFSSTATMYKNFYKENREKIRKLFTAHRAVGDLSFCIYLLDKGKVYIVNECMAVYRARRSENEYNYNSMRNILQIAEDHIQILNINSDYYNGKYNFWNLYNAHLENALIFCKRQKEFNKFTKLLNQVPSKIRNKFLWTHLGAILKQLVRNCKR